MQNPKLFMLLLGCKPSGRHTEQHDIFFTIAENIIDTEEAVKAFWPEAKGKVHIDAWREVTQVNGLRIRIVPKGDVIEQVQKLFFLNLGGYKEKEFEEFHYKMLVVANDVADAKKEAIGTVFYKHTNTKDAPSHIDDKYGVDVDDSYIVKDILPIEFKKRYDIIIDSNFESSLQSDEIHLGYQLYEKIKK